MYFIILGNSIGGIFLSMISMMLVLFGTGLFLSVSVIGVLMFCCGLGVAPMQLTAFFVANQHNPARVGAAAVAVVNTGGLLAGAVFQPLVGAFLDLGRVDSASQESVVVGESENTSKEAGVPSPAAGNELQWTSLHMRIVFVGVFMTCYVVAGFIAAFALADPQSKSSGGEVLVNVTKKDTMHTCRSENEEEVVEMVEVVI
jgi:hypothetical protein